VGPLWPLPGREVLIHRVVCAIDRKRRGKLSVKLSVSWGGAICPSPWTRCPATCPVPGGNWGQACQRCVEDGLLPAACNARNVESMPRTDDTTGVHRRKACRGGRTTNCTDGLCIAPLIITSVSTACWSQVLHASKSIPICCCMSPGVTACEQTSLISNADAWCLIVVVRVRCPNQGATPTDVGPNCHRTCRLTNTTSEQGASWGHAYARRSHMSPSMRQEAQAAATGPE
jgi:hypothetical protein